MSREPETITARGPSGPVRVPNPKYAAEHRARRERIATAVLAAWVNTLHDDLDEYDDEPKAFAEHKRECAKLAIGYADALLAELDKEQP